MKIIDQVSFILIPILIFLYLFWKRLKEDYTRNQIFTAAFYILIGFLAGKTVADYFLREWWFWLAFGGGLIGTFIAIYRFKLRTFEIIEAGVKGGLILLIAVYLQDWLKSGNISSAIGAGIIVLFYILFIILNKHYRRFTWYRSGKVGFTGLVITGSFLLVRTLVALTFPHVLSFVGVYDAIISGILAFMSFLLLFNLARQVP